MPAFTSKPDMNQTTPWVHDANAPLLTDLYELTMLQAYWKEGLHGEAVFDLFVRKLPAHRNYLLACGLDDTLRYLERLQFDEGSLVFLKSRKEFSPEFVEWLRAFRFTGDVYAAPEGTPIFPNEPILEVVAPLPEAQLVETFLLNQVQFQTLLASKAARVVDAAAGRSVVDFGIRRMHGADAALKSARAFYIAGVNATSNVLAAQVYGVPIAGTMAHSYIQAHEDELTAFREFTALYPDTILLVDTYETLEGVQKVIRLARELGERFQVKGVRLDSGDLAKLAVQSRKLLDDAGLDRVGIFLSGGLDEYAIAKMVSDDTPVIGFGVGTNLGVSEDAPALDSVYKLTAYDGKGRLKTSSGKQIYPGRKQIFRIEEAGRAVRDVLALHEEKHEGRPLLRAVMRNGKRLEAGSETLETIRDHAKTERAKLPEAIRALNPADPPYPV